MGDPIETIPCLNCENTLYEGELFHVRGKGDFCDAECANAYDTKKQIEIKERLADPGKWKGRYTLASIMLTHERAWHMQTRARLRAVLKAARRYKLGIAPPEIKRLNAGAASELDALRLEHAYMKQRLSTLQENRTTLRRDNKWLREKVRRLEDELESVEGALHNAQLKLVGITNELPMEILLRDGKKYVLVEDQWGDGEDE